MKRLTSPQLRKLLTFLEGLAAIPDQEAFVRYLLAAAPGLIPCEMLTYNEMIPSQRISRNWVVPQEVHPPETDAIWAQHMHEHPTLMYYAKTREGQARTISDFLSQSQLHRLGLYNELYRGWHVEDVLTAVCHVSITAPTIVVGVGFYRNRRTFSERDRLLLNLLRPHLVQTYARIQAHTHFREELVRAKQALDTLEQGVIVLARDGSVREITLRARQLLRAYWGAAPEHEGHLPPELQEWIGRQQGPAPLAEPDGSPIPPMPFIVERETARLVVRLVRFGTEDHLLVLEEQPTVLVPSFFGSLGLTARESEVLLWVTRGKTDAEIATILGVSPKTVGKHLERIYQKLGAENRTAAAMCALTAIRPR
ncbi:MAG: hypothetical protein C3F12_03900 [Candidatus Methylomirabilota bacterium]|nr:helix-turn-helix transcriptional regulator [Candidatus Methylomirabilis sp.]NJD68713.1 helix-turn-helix transcriptional regulator [candidate division NC10 bacterium]PWB47138.1 MAG: hypothetical protein C3F12_03900 [candidate division NC10 bacterium]